VAEVVVDNQTHQGHILEEQVEQVAVVMAEQLKMTHLELEKQELPTQGVAVVQHQNTQVVLMLVEAVVQVLL
tara:strand:+ start:513 stop:728 length:216 start_codon:yes stop_codon:yes gene_type:complete